MDPKQNWILNLEEVFNSSNFMELAKNALEIKIKSHYINNRSLRFVKYYSNSDF